MSHKDVLAVDFGASNGRVVLGDFDGDRISIREIHRFPNDLVILDRTMYWDFLRLFFEVKQGLMKAKRCRKIDSIGVDTWGVGFSLIDKKGHLLENPVHYRDARTAGMLEKSFGEMDKDRLYQVAGNQFMEINTVFQLLALLEKRPGLLEGTPGLLLMSDLFNYYLYGTQVSEYSIASTTQMLGARTEMWSRKVLENLGISGRILNGTVPCGVRLGSIETGVCRELGIGSMEVIAVAGHDTQSTLAAVPARGRDFIFISCGVWSLFGTELGEPVINGLSERLNITNEGGCQGEISFLKNITGLWLIQESRRQWIREGEEYNFGHLEQTTTDAEPFKALIGLDASEFAPAGNIPERIRRYCRGSRQRIPENEAETARYIDESLAFKYRMTLEEIKMCAGREYPAIHTTGGGTQSGFLCQMTTNACHCPVIAESVEATILGNTAVQLLTAGELRDLDQMRSVAGASAEVSIYEPEGTDQWE